MSSKSRIGQMLSYAILTMKHKYFVYVAGRYLDVPVWRLIVHDLSKLSLVELPHYGRQFFGPADDPDGFIKCWIHHQNHNDHHWEYWVPRTGHNRCDPPYPDGEPVKMPFDAAAEMIADWLGAGRAYEGKWPDLHNWTWLDENLPKMKLHERTRNFILGTVAQLRNRQGKPGILC